MKIVMAASEVVPFAKTGGLADVAGALPLALEELGAEVIIIMPAYKAVKCGKFKIQSLMRPSDICHCEGAKRPKQSQKQDCFAPEPALSEAEGGLAMTFAEEPLDSGVSCSSIGKNIKVYFIENAAYFNRDGLYQDKGVDYPDNLERFAFFCKRSLQLLKEINFKPDVIHVHDWQACLIPIYLKSIFVKDAFYKNIRTVLTIHNIGYQGLFLKDEFPKLGLDWSLFNIEGLEFYGKVNLLKGGMEFCDIINTVSPTYSKEIQTKEFGFGLEGVLLKRRNRLFGILNGVDYSIWSPETDKLIAKNFSLQTVADKAKNKEGLQKSCHLPLKKDVPLCGIVSRLAEQKGFDILAEGIDTICKMGLQLVILGTGDPKYHQILGDMVKKYPKVISLNLKFDDTLAHNIYAGSDLFLMPSRYEPCGLGQLISLKYGTIPLVFATGGLADTVNKDNGFIFHNYSSVELIKTLKKALVAFKDGQKWSALVAKAMQCDFSWDESAKKYLQLYARAKAVSLCHCEEAEGRRSNPLGV